MTVVQRLEMVRRISLEIDADVVELGTDGRQIKCNSRSSSATTTPPASCRARLSLQPGSAHHHADDVHLGRARRIERQRVARLHRAGKGFRLSNHVGGAGLGAEFTGLPRHGGNPAAAVRPRRSSGARVRLASRSARGQRQRSTVRRRHRVHSASARDCRCWPSRRSPTSGRTSFPAGVRHLRQPGVRHPRQPARLRQVPAPPARTAAWPIAGCRVGRAGCTYRRRSGRRGSGQLGAEPMPVHVTSVVTCSPGLIVLTRVSLEGAQSRLDHSRVL